MLIIALRNYLLTFQTDIAITEDEFLKDNTCGIIRDASGRYYAASDLPDYLSQISVDGQHAYQDFVDQAFQRRGNARRDENREGVFYGTNTFIIINAF